MWLCTHRYLITASVVSFCLGALVANNYVQWQTNGTLEDKVIVAKTSALLFLTNSAEEESTMQQRSSNTGADTTIFNNNNNNNNKNVTKLGSTRHEQHHDHDEVGKKRKKSTSNLTAHFSPAGTKRMEAIQNMLKPRVWNMWSKPLPCFEPDPDLGWQKEFANHGEHGTHTDMGGLFMAKPKKVGGSTIAGVHLRMMHALARRLGKDYPVCRGNCQHGEPRVYRHVRDKSLLWSVVRDPTKRSISWFFHFYVSRFKVEPTDHNFLETLHLLPEQKKKGGHYAKTLSLREKTKESRELYQEILDSYDFIGVTERMDDSLVVLKELLGLKTSDILFMNAKTNGSWDDGRYKTGCTMIVPSYVSPGMKEAFGSDQWLDQIQYDLALHIAVNKSLDMTIDQRIGRERFDQALSEFHNLQRIVHEECEDEVRYPCSPGGEKVEDANCYFNDWGCGYPCMDRVVAELGLN